MSSLGLFHASLCLIYAFLGLLCLFKVFLRPFEPLYKQLNPEYWVYKKAQFSKLLETPV